MSWAPPNGPCPKSPSNKPAAIWSLPYWEKVTFPWLVRVHSFWEDSQQWFGGKRQGKVYYSCFQVQFEMMHLIHYASKHASTLLGISVYLVSNLPIQAHCLFQKVSFIQFSSVQWLGRVRLFATPWIAACQACKSSIEYSGLISFRIDWLDLLAVQRTLKSLFQHHRPITSWQINGETMKTLTDFTFLGLEY